MRSTARSFPQSTSCGVRGPGLAGKCDGEVHGHDRADCGELSSAQHKQKRESECCVKNSALNGVRGLLRFYLELSFTALNYGATTDRAQPTDSTLSLRGPVCNI